MTVTPTDDEREALIDAIRRSVAGTHGIQAYLAGVFADAILAAGFRRSEVPGEPSDAAARALAIHDAWGTPNDPDGKTRPTSDYTNLSARMAQELRKGMRNV